jgi:hypothetical protein
MDPNLDRLKGILNKSQAIMNEVDTGKYDKTNRISNAPRAPRPAPAPRRQPQMNENFNTNTQVDSAYAARVNGSGFSEEVKRAMINNPIPTDVSGTWSASDIMNESYNPQPVSQPTMQPVSHHGGYAPQTHQGGYAPQTQTGGAQAYPPQQTYYPPQQPSLTTEDVKRLVKEVLTEMMMENITENAVKSTLKTMISEGKLKTRKRT